MKSLAVSTILALSALETCSASAQNQRFEARQASFPIVTFYFGGNHELGDPNKNFRQGVPEDGETHSISKEYRFIPMPIYVPYLMDC